jgi:chromosomal replication initiator protein
VSRETVVEALDELEESLVALWAAVHKVRQALVDDTAPEMEMERATPARRLLVVVAEHYDVTVADLTGPSRRRDILRPRRVAMYLLRDHLHLTYPSIGRLLHRDHSTVVYGARRVRDEEDTAQLAELLEDYSAP